MRYHYNRADSLKKNLHMCKINNSNGMFTINFYFISFAINAWIQDSKISIQLYDIDLKKNTFQNLSKIIKWCVCTVDIWYDVIDVDLFRNDQYFIRKPVHYNRNSLVKVVKFQMNLDTFLQPQFISMKRTSVFFCVLKYGNM